MGIVRRSMLHTNGALRPAIEQATANAATPVTDELRYISSAIVIPTEYMVVNAKAVTTWPTAMWDGEADRYRMKRDEATQIAPKQNRNFLPNLSESSPMGTLVIKRTTKPTEIIMPIWIREAPDSAANKDSVGDCMLKATTMRNEVKKKSRTFRLAERFASTSDKRVIHTLELARL
jgi:hypothetical protein